MNLNTGAAHASASTSSEVPQISPSIPTNPTCSSSLGKHRSAIQTTVDKLGELVERSRVLLAEQPTNIFTIIPPIRRSPRNGPLGREVPIPSQALQPTPPEDTQNPGGVGRVVGFTPATVISQQESIGMGGRHHCLPVPNQQPGGAEEEVPGGAQEAVEESITATESGAAGTTTTQVPDAGQVETGEEESELPGLGSQEATLPPT
jgi:hypothetical protein